MSVDVPDQKGRLEILKVHARNKKFGEDVDIKEVAMRTPGFSGADLSNLLNEAAILAGRRNLKVGLSSRAERGVGRGVRAQQILQVLGMPEPRLALVT